MFYQRVQLPSTNIGQPGPLPPELAGLDEASLADLSAALDPAACQQLGFVGQGFVRVADAAPPAPALSPYDFLLLFTTAERVGILAAAQSSMAIADWLNMLNHVPDVHLDNPETIAGVQALETAGLIAHGRAAQVLANIKP